MWASLADVPAQSGAAHTTAAVRVPASRRRRPTAEETGRDAPSIGVQGIGRPVHQLTQVNMGLPLVDNAYTEDAAVEAARR